MTLLTDFTREFIECRHLRVFMVNACEKRSFQRMQVCFSILCIFFILTVKYFNSSCAWYSSPSTADVRLHVGVLCVHVCTGRCLPGQGRAGLPVAVIAAQAEQSRAGVLWSLFLSCSATWTFYHKPGIISSPLAFLLPVILTSCLLSLIPLFSLSLWLLFLCLLLFLFFFDSSRPSPSSPPF